MIPQATFTTGKIAAHCQVSAETVINWIKGGKLEAFTTSGGHRRVHRADFRTFLETYGMPPLDEDLGARPRILIVDDEPDIVRLITTALTRTGQYELATAADGFEAGIAFAKFRPDLVVLDLMMPHIDGFKVCRRIKSQPDTRSTLVLVVTGYAQPANIQRVLDQGADDFMAKPFKPFELAEKVEALVEGKTGFSTDVLLAS